MIDPPWSSTKWAFLAAVPRSTLPEFSLAFWILAIDRTVLGTLTFATEWRQYVFLLRLLAFCLILYGIIEKNRK